MSFFYIYIFFSFSYLIQYIYNFFIIKIIKHIKWKVLKLFFITLYFKITFCEKFSLFFCFFYYYIFYIILIKKN